jgi:class 3 adenylate cyclase
MKNYFQNIAAKILEDRCVIICGSQLSALVNDSYSNNRIAARFLSDPTFNESYSVETDQFENKPLPEVFQQWIEITNSNDENYENRIKWINNNFLRQYYDLENNPSPAHMILVNLGCKYIFTTNYDSLIEEAYVRAGFPRNTINVVPSHNADSRIHFDFPYVYKLCGTAGEPGIKLAKEQFNNAKFQMSDEMRLRLLRRIIVFIGFDTLDDIMLSPIVRTIESSSPEAFYCVTNLKSTTPDCLSCLGAPMRLIEIDISDFLSQLYMELLSQTSDHFGYFATKRKIVENSALAYIRHSFTNKELAKLKEVRRRLDEQQEKMKMRASVGNTWYWDFAFHQGLYKAIPIKVFEKDFAKTYIKLRVSYSTYQSKSSLAEHEEIYSNLAQGKIAASARCLNRHLRNVTETATFWLKYFTVINHDILQSALHDYRSPLITEDGIQLDERVLKNNNKVLVLGDSGSGKTTFSIRQVIMSITTGSSIPIYIDLGSTRFGKNQINSMCAAQTFVHFLLSYFETMNLNSKSPRMLSYIIEEKVVNGEFLLILDGIEKLSAVLLQSLLERIRSFCLCKAELKLIITSQSDSLLVSHGETVCISEFVGFSDRQIHALPIVKSVNIRTLPGNRAILAVVLVDIVDSTRFSLEVGDDKMVEIKKLHFEQADTLAREFRGEILRKVGDEHVAVFWNSCLALDYALRLYWESGYDQLRIRVGIHVADLKISTDHNIDHPTLAYTKRVINQIGTASEIWLSNEAMNEINQMNKRQHSLLQWHAVEDLQLRGFPGTHVLWRLVQYQKIKTV